MRMKLIFFLKTNGQQLLWLACNCSHTRDYVSGCPVGFSLCMNQASILCSSLLLATQFLCDVSLDLNYRFCFSCCLGYSWLCMWVVSGFAPPYFEGSLVLISWSSTWTCSDLFPSGKSWVHSFLICALPCPISTNTSHKLIILKDTTM